MKSLPDNYLSQFRLCFLVYWDIVFPSRTRYEARESSNPGSDRRAGQTPPVSVQDECEEGDEAWNSIGPSPMQEVPLPSGTADAPRDN